MALQQTTRLGMDSDFDFNLEPGPATGVGSLSNGASRWLFLSFHLKSRPALLIQQKWYMPPVLRDWP
jgi:hypothetical protein